MKRLLTLLVAFCWHTVADAAAVDYDRQAITIALAQEPPSLDTTKTTDLVSFFVLGHVAEGLVRYDQAGHLVPGVAASWQVSDTAIEFMLREDARWSDGSPVTADDFVYAWRLVNDPANAAPYAAIMYPIRNAEQVQKGELPVSELGVTAIDARRLRVELEAPCGYCISLMVHATFYPVKAAFHRAQGADYGARPANLLYNGPFMLVDWVHGARLKLIANPDYWNADAIVLREINIDYITEDTRTKLNLFRDGAIALTRLGAETVDDALAQGLRLRTFVSGGMAFVRFNMAAGRLSADPRIRRAIAQVFDPEEFVNRVIGIPGYRAAHSFFPSWVQGAERPFIEEYPLPPRELDLEGARALVTAATGGQKAELTLLSVTSPTGAKIAEYFQGLISARLGLDVRVDQQILKLYLEKNRSGDFDLALSSWYPDFDDIVTFADLLGSWNANNRGGYKDALYDEQLGILMRASEPGRRMAAAAELQRIIFRDVPVLPMAETGSAYLQHPRLRGVVRRVLGADPDYTHARVVP
ncbi:MAG: peptide ABC transporter substrate-binding protein [Pseudomonadota bacterium]